MATENNTGPLTSPRPRERPETSSPRPQSRADSEEYQRRMQENLGDLEFEADLNPWLKRNPLAALGFDPKRTHFAPWDETHNAYYFNSGEDFSPEDRDRVVATGDFAKNPIWAHEYTHRGIEIVKEYALQDPEMFIRNYGQDAYRLVLTSGAGGPDSEHTTEMFDNPDEEFNLVLNNLFENSPSLKYSLSNTLSDATREQSRAFSQRGEFTDDTPEQIKRGMAGLMQAAKDLTPSSLRGYAEGGPIDGQVVDKEGMVDPVSGNPVPPGSAPEEVRDDVPINASENEFMFPAYAVRYHGIEKLQSLIKQAQEALGHSDTSGAPMVGEELAKGGKVPPDPMSTAQTMAEGGPVPGQGGTIDNTATFEPWKYQTGGRAFDSRDVSYSRRRYMSKDGTEKRTIVFYNGKPLQPIPEGYMEDTPENRKAIEQVKEDTGQNQIQNPINFSSQGAGVGGATPEDLEERARTGQKDYTRYMSYSSEEALKEAQRNLAMGDRAEGFLGTISKGIFGGLAGGIAGQVAGPAAGALGAKLGARLGQGMGQGMQVGVASNLALAEILRAKGDTAAADRVLSMTAENMGLSVDQLMTDVVPKYDQRRDDILNKAGFSRPEGQPQTRPTQAPPVTGGLKVATDMANSFAPGSSPRPQQSPFMSGGGGQDNLSGEAGGSDGKGVGSPSTTNPQTSEEAFSGGQNIGTPSGGLGFGDSVPKDQSPTGSVEDFLGDRNIGSPPGGLGFDNGGGGYVSGVDDSPEFNGAKGGLIKKPEKAYKKGGVIKRRC